MRLLILYYSMYGHVHRLAEAGRRDNWMSTLRRSTIAGPRGERVPSENELAGTGFQGRHMANGAKKLVE